MLFQVFSQCFYQNVYTLWMCELLVFYLCTWQRHIEWMRTSLDGDSVSSVLCESFQHGSSQGLGLKSFQVLICWFTLCAIHHPISYIMCALRSFTCPITYPPSEEPSFYLTPNIVAVCFEIYLQHSSGVRPRRAQGHVTPQICPISNDFIFYY